MNLTEDIVQCIASDIVDIPSLGKTWESIDPVERFKIMDRWRKIIRYRIRESLKEITSESF